MPPLFPPENDKVSGNIYQEFRKYGSLIFIIFRFFAELVLPVFEGKRMILVIYWIDKSRRRKRVKMKERKRKKRREVRRKKR